MLLAAAMVTTVGLSGCSVLDGGDSSSSTPTTASTAARKPPSGSEALASYYGQSLAWKKCQIGECAGLKVPLD